MILAIPAELSCSQGSLTLSYFESSKRSHKGQCQTHPDIYVEDIHIKLQHDTGNL